MLIYLCVYTFIFLRNVSIYHPASAMICIASIDGNILWRVVASLANVFYLKFGRFLSDFYLITNNVELADDAQ